MKVESLYARRRLLLVALFAVLVVLFLTAATTEAAPEQSCGFYHYVRHGQTLNMIARHYGVPVNALLSANPQIKNPDVIYAGSKIFIPCWKPGHPGYPGHPGMGGRCSHVHYVKSGQTLSEIAYYYHVPSYWIMRANGIHNPDLIYAGTYLCIP